MEVLPTCSCPPDVSDVAWAPKQSILEYSGFGPPSLNWLELPPGTEKPPKDGLAFVAGRGQYCLFTCFSCARWLPVLWASGLGKRHCKRTLFEEFYKAEESSKPTMSVGCMRLMPGFSQTRAECGPGAASACSACSACRRCALEGPSVDTTSQNFRCSCYFLQQR